MLNVLFWIFYILLFVICLFMILLVLIQKGRGGGLSSSFGGGGGNTAFGSKTGDVLTWTTSIVFGIFMLLAVGLNLVANARQKAWNTAHGISNVSAPVEGPTSPPPSDSD